MVLHDFSFVPGVAAQRHVPGPATAQLQASTIRVFGSQAAPRHGPGRHAARRVSGTLGGAHFDVSSPGVRISRAQGGPAEWPTGRVKLPLPGLAQCVESCAPGGARIR